MSEQLYEYRNIVGALIIAGGAIVAILLISRTLHVLKLRKIIDKRTEASLRFIFAGLISIIAVLSAASIAFEIQHGLVASGVLLIIILLPVAYVVTMYISNLFSYLIISLSNIIVEGDYIRVDIGEKSYEGRALLSMGEFLELRTDDGNVVYVPYSKLRSSVVTKLAGAIVNLKLVMKGSNLNVADAMKTVEMALSSSTAIDKGGSSVELTMVQETGEKTEAAFMIRARLVNPRNVERAKEEIMRYFLKAELPYDVSVAVAEE